MWCSMKLWDKEREDKGLLLGVNDGQIRLDIGNPLLVKIGQVRCNGKEGLMQQGCCLSGIDLYRLYR